MVEIFDIVVIGGGPGGYSAAIRCAQKGAKVAIVEKDAMGGTCLNRGCIPSKALLASVHFLAMAKNSNLMGCDIDGTITPNWTKMVARKDAIVKGFSQGVSGLLKSNKITIFSGVGVVSSPGVLKVTASDGSISEIKAGKIILATGSVPVEIPDFPFDGNVVISSNEALSLSSVPKSMVIVGGGVIGCEMACVYSQVGAKVTIVEALPGLLPNEDEWVSTMLIKEFKKLGIVTMVGKQVKSVEVLGDSARVSLGDGEVIDADKVLIAVGRKSIIDNETVSSLGLEMNGGVIKVNDMMETNVQGVYAIGDVVGTTYLAHGAFMEAEVAAENALGGDKKMEHYHLIPRAVYTFPEVASVGRSEKKAKELGIDVSIGKSHFRTNGRSVAHNENIGEIRVIKDKSTDRVIGVTMVGATVTELVGAARSLIGSSEEILDVCFPHPTVSEVLKEAWEDAFDLSVHTPPKV